MASNGLPAAASETVDDLVYETQTPSPAKYLAFGSTEKDENGNVTAVPEYIPKPIVFESLLDERAERKRKLAAGFRVFGKFGWGFGVNGHLTARDPIKTDCFWINPYGLPFSKIKVSDLILVDAQGNTIYGRYPTCNPAGWAIHHMLHLQRDDIIAAAHAHTPSGTSFSAFGELLLPYAQDSCAVYERHAVFDGLPLIGNTVEAQKMAALLGEKNIGIIAQNHGLFTVGSTVDEALWWFILMERICEYQLKIMSASTAAKPLPIPHEIAVIARDGGVGGPHAGFMGFLPHYLEIEAEQPDFLD